MKNLYFQRSNGEEIIIKKDVQNDDEISSLIEDFLKSHNYKSYYTRIWTVDNVTHYDVGSYTEFFLVKNED